jgi:hypothetical protein
MRGAKLSEYRFLKILRAFAYGLSPKDAAAETGVSEKTVRTTYAALRLKVMEAAQSGKHVFGLGSRYLYVNGKLTEKGAVFLEAVAKSKLLDSYLADHSPRLKDEAAREIYVFDLGMRIFTGLAVVDQEFLEPSPGLRRSFILLAAMQSWIDANKDAPGFVEKNHETLERHARLTRMADIVQEQQQIITLRQSAKHRYTGERFYSDLRKYLMFSPVNG